MRKVYLDHSATTPIDPEVFNEMLPFLKEHFGNPSSLHSWGRKARKAVEGARESVAKLISADSSEIIFTGGGSESNNLAIKGTALALQGKGKHIITSSVEHHAVLEVCEWLEKIGFEITYLPVDEYGRVSVEDLKNKIRQDTILVSIMYGNNEVGTLQPIREIGKICRERGIIFHVDGVQAVGHIPVNVKEDFIDMLTISAHKMYGPKGVGALYIRKDIKLTPLIHGGGQEKGLRSGTENVTGIVGLGAASKLALKRLSNGDEERVKKLRNKLIDGVLREIPDVILTGHREERLPFHASFCFKYIEGEAIVLRLDAAGIGASSGSACSTGKPEPSHVLIAMGIPREIIHGSLRLTLGKDNSESDIDYVIEKLKETVDDLRKISPFGKEK